MNLYEDEDNESLAAIAVLFASLIAGLWGCAAILVMLSQVSP